MRIVEQPIKLCQQTTGEEEISAAVAKCVCDSRGSVDEECYSWGSWNIRLTLQNLSFDFFQDARVRSQDY